MNAVRKNRLLEAVAPGPAPAVAETVASGEALFRAALGKAMELAPDGYRLALQQLLRTSMELEGAAAGDGLLDVYQVGADLAELDQLLQRTKGRRDQAAAVDAWLAALGETDRLARLGRYLAALDAAHTAHQDRGTQLVKQARGEKARRDLLRDRLQQHLVKHRLPRITAGDYVMQVIEPKRSDVELLVPVDHLPEHLRSPDVQWVPREAELIDAYERALAARERRMAEIEAWIQDEDCSREEAEALFPAGEDEDALRYVQVKERTGRHLRITRRGGASQA